MSRTVAVVPSEVAAEYGPRLQAAGAALRDAQAAVELKRDALRRIVVQAADAGMYQRAIAAAAGYKSPARVTQLLADSARDDDQ